MIKIFKSELPVIYFSIKAMAQECGLERCEEEILKIKDSKRRKKFISLYKEILRNHFTEEDL